MRTPVIWLGYSVVLLCTIVHPEYIRYNSNTTMDVSKRTIDTYRAAEPAKNAATRVSLDHLPCAEFLVGNVSVIICGISGGARFGSVSTTGRGSTSQASMNGARYQTVIDMVNDCTKSQRTSVGCLSKRTLSGSGQLQLDVATMIVVWVALQQCQPRTGHACHIMTIAGFKIVNNVNADEQRCR